MFVLSPVLSPNLSPSLPACSSARDAVSAAWSCLCLVSGLVSQLVSQSASSFFSLGCCVRFPGLVFVLFWVLSPNLSPSLPACSSARDAVSGCLVLSLSCLRSCLPTCLPVCQLVLQPGMLCPLPWSCLCLVSGLVSQLVSQSASLFFSLGRCVRLPGLVFLLSQVLSPILSSSCSGMRRLCSGLVSKILCAICATVWGLRWCIFFWPELFHIVDGRNPAPPGMHKTLQKIG